MRKSSGGRSSRQSDHSLTENVASHNLRQAKQIQGACKVGDVEMGCLGETFNSQEDHKVYRREEFEKNLREMGLELEKDEEVSLYIYFGYLLKMVNALFSVHASFYRG